MNLTVETKNFIDGLNGAPLYEMGYEGARGFLENLQENETCAGFEDYNLNSRLNVRVVKPPFMSEKTPVIFYIHGGGWVLGSKNSWAPLLNELVKNTGAAVIFPEYSLSPEAKFPIALDEIYFVYENLEKLNVNTKNVIIAGDSAGANMAITTAIRAAKNKKPFKFQLLFYPVTDASMKTPSYSEFEDGPWLTKKAMEWFFNAYLEKDNLRFDPKVSPILASENELSLLPETLIITAENDVLRDEGENFAAKLDNIGVKTACIRVNGTCHDFMVLNALAKTAPKEIALLTACAKMNEIFKTDR